MKKTLIGGFVSLVGTLWALAVVFMAGSNPVNSWTTPPGRFLTTLAELKWMPVFAVAILLTVLGLVIMGVEFFKKEHRG